MEQVKSEGGAVKVNFAAPRSFGTAFKSDLKETLFPDDPFHDFKGKPFAVKAKKAIQYFVPVFQWLPNYNRILFFRDMLAGVTIASLAIPQGI
nr:probable sulfate transporter 3.5 [Tanacetum cinerariifolium]